MNLKRLETFIRVADLHHFSEAADALDLTQSAVSRQIKTLEEELGLQLFHRNTAFVELTSSGRIAYKRARELLDHADQFREECKQLASGLSGELKIGASTIPAAYMMPRMVSLYQRKYPQTLFSIMTDDSARIVHLLEERRIDVAIVGIEPANSGFVSRVIAEDRLALIGNGGMNPVSSLTEVLRHPFIVREKGSGTRAAMNRVLQEHGIVPDQLQVAAEVNTTESVLAMVEAGVGLSFVSCWAVCGSRQRNTRILMELPTDRRFFAMVHESQRDNVLIHTLIEELVREFGNHLP